MFVEIKMRGGVLLLVGVVTVCMADYKPPKYTIDLDKPAEERWVEVFADFEKPIKKIMKAAGAELTKTEYYTLFALLQKSFLTPDQQKELQGACDAIGLDYKMAIILNFMYELHAFCTSIVAKTPDGSIIHGRNLDYPYAELFAELTVDLTFVKNGKTLYVATGTAGSLGIITGMRPGKWSVSINERHDGSLYGNL
jgi:hypothetical protein